ncbi:hypothetical protein EMIT0347P_100107 [Pseudomonas sp. IT-347P]
MPHRADPQVAQIIETGAFGRCAAEGTVLFEHQWQGHQRWNVGRAVRRARADVISRVMHFTHVRINVGQALRRNIEEAEGERGTDPFVQVVSGERDAEGVEVELDLTECMGAVEDDIDAMLFGQRGDGLHRHHQTGAVSDVSQGHQLEFRLPDKRLAISFQQAVVARRVRVGDLDHLGAAMSGQPAHRAFDRVVFQITDQHLIARLQAVVVANQRLQAFGGIAGERYALRTHANQLGQLGADIKVVVLFETLAHVHRVAVVDQLDIALVFLDHRARHAPEVTIFQVHGAGLNVVAIGERLPEGFVTGAAGVIGHGRLTLKEEGALMARGRFAVFGAQRFEQIRQAVMVDLLHQREQATEFAVGETFTGKPVQVRPRQVGNDPALVFAEGHFAGDQQFEFFGIHQ